MAAGAAPPFPIKEEIHVVRLARGWRVDVIQNRGLLKPPRRIASEHWPAENQADHFAREVQGVTRAPIFKGGKRHPYQEPGA